MGKEYLVVFSLTLLSPASGETVFLIGLQQQPIAAWSMKARFVRMAAIHIKINIFTPISALILSESCAVRAIFAARLITVAIMAARDMMIPEIAARIAIGRVNQRVRITSGEASIRTKFRTVPAVKQTYMICDPSFKRLRMVLTSDGKAIEAPARSSLTSTSTGLNQ